ncbi:AraC family transcriptional regulator ligand-binding domain-containing protein [Paenibacillus sp. Soil766]|uniref:AraC family transcriptional regulator ligand-binding domain-containing protein n=1 Tax=Paenibacillus sp. Soil766 TaxID=1736404 RepID=UPI0012F72DF4|nr:AraC family transcriptional regulator ligand-binding domain-containing protein [Paenibacillus sp. Soil766]
MRKGEPSYGHSLSVSLIHPILSYMVGKGYNSESFCLFASFDKRILQEAEARIGEEEFDRLLDSASAFTHDQNFGLHLGQTIELSSLGILGYVLLHCSTIEEVLAAYRRYNVILCSGIEIEWETSLRETAILFKVSDPARQVSRHAIEGMVSSLYHIILKLSCRNFVLNELRFAHEAPKESGEYINLLGINPMFKSSANLIRLDNEV